MKTKVILINTVDRKGGAAEVAYSIFEKGAMYNLDCNMLVDYKFFDNPNVHLFNPSKSKESVYNRLSVLSKKIIKKDIPSFIKFKINDIKKMLLLSDFEFFNNIVFLDSYRKFDIIHLHNLHGNYFNLASLKKVSKIRPTVWTLHDMWALTGHCSYSYDCERWEIGCGSCPYLSTYPSLPFDNTSNLWKKKEDIYNNSILDIVVPSQWLMKKVKKSILSNHNLHLIYNGINVDDFFQHDKFKARKELGLPLNRKIIIFLASNGDSEGRKGWKYVEEMKHRFSDVLFLCVGGKKKEPSSGNLIHIKHIDDKKIIAKYFSASDIFLFTSLAENFPLVLLEAMACGTPVVSFDVGGSNEAVIHKENGYISAYKDSDDLEKGIKYILNLGEKDIAEMSALSRKRAVNNFSLDLMIDNYSKLYKKIVNRR